MKKVNVEMKRNDINDVKCTECKKTILNVVKLHPHNNKDQYCTSCYNFWFQ